MVPQTYDIKGEPNIYVNQQYLMWANKQTFARKAKDKIHIHKASCIDVLLTIQL